MLEKNIIYILLYMDIKNKSKKRMRVDNEPLQKYAAQR